MEIYQYLNLAQTINNKRNVNKLILAHLLTKDLLWITANLNTIVKNEKLLKNYLAIVKKYTDGLPLGYILGYVFFNNNKIFVSKDVLIPRNETEILVNQTLLYAKKIFNSQSLAVLDLCTGSGCIAISLALVKPEWHFVASDISSKALAIASSNKQFYHLNNIVFVESDLFANLNDKFDVIIANPPYVDQKSQSYCIGSLKHEPALALFADNYGLSYYQKILSAILNYTKKTFIIAFEIGFDQKQALTKLLKKDFSNYFYWFEKDYSDHWRFLFISSKKL